MLILQPAVIDQLNEPHLACPFGHGKKYLGEQKCMLKSPKNEVTINRIYATK
jgi:hypothetical protein